MGRKAEVSGSYLELIIKTRPQSTSECRFNKSPHNQLPLRGALLPPHGRRWARSLDDGILVKQRGRLWVCHDGVTRSRVDPPVRPRDRRHRMRNSVRTGIGSGGFYSQLGSPRHFPGVRLRAGAHEGFPNLLTSLGGDGLPVTFPSQQHSAGRQAPGGRGFVPSTCGFWSAMRDGVWTSPC